jgi:hypothetical protein
MKRPGLRPPPAERNYPKRDNASPQRPGPHLPAGVRMKAATPRAVRSARSTTLLDGYELSRRAWSIRDLSEMQSE